MHKLIKRGRVLLVEDNVDDAQIVLKFFEENHSDERIFRASDGKEALDYMFGRIASDADYTTVRPRHIPLIILLDLNLPRVSGLEFLRILKKNPRTNRIPVLILTGIKDHPDLVECRRLGVSTFLLKPNDGSKPLVPLGNLGANWFNELRPRKTEI